MTPNVFLAMPCYGSIEREAMQSAMMASRAVDHEIRMAGSSLLALTFNSLWCIALNERRTRGWTHFAMLHNDVSPEPGWLDIMLAEMERVGADVLSLVLPIKDRRGLTSTGLFQGDRVRRLTFRELADKPETFNSSDFGYPDGTLAINTGCWVCRFTEPWVEKVHFEIRDRIDKQADGTFKAMVLSEDWNFSRLCRPLGVKLFATRKIRAVHYGRHDYRNDETWGTLDTDDFK